MELKDVINECDINFKIGEKIKYINECGVEKEGTIMQINLVLDSVLGLLKGDIEYLIECSHTCKVDKAFEENIIREIK